MTKRKRKDKAARKARRQRNRPTQWKAVSTLPPMSADETIAGLEFAGISYEVVESGDGSVEVKWCLPEGRDAEEVYVQIIEGAKVQRCTAACR